MIENCVAMVTIAAVAILASSFNGDTALASAGIAAIAGLAGHNLGATTFGLKAPKTQDSPPSNGP